VAKLVVGDRGRWVNRGRQNGRRERDAGRRSSSRGRVVQRVGLGGEDQIEINSIEVRMKMESIAHDNDLDDAFTVTGGVFEGLFHASLIAESKGTVRVDKMVLAKTFAHDGRNASRIAFAKLEDLLNLSRDDREEVRTQSVSVRLKEIVEVVGRIRGARIQDENTFDARETVRESREIARGRSHFWMRNRRERALLITCQSGNTLPRNKER
jgi:hypothetical protein